MSAIIHSRERILAKVNLKSSRYHFDGELISQAVDKCIEEEDQLDHVQLFSTAREAEAFQQENLNWKQVPDETQIAKRVLFDRNHIMDLMPRENSIINQKTDRKSMIYHYLFGRITSMNGRNMRAKYFNNVPIPPPRYVKGKLYPHFILNKKASIQAKKVVLKPLNKLDFVVNDIKSNAQVVYVSNNTAKLNRVFALNFYCRSQKKKTPTSLSQCCAGVQAFPTPNNEILNDLFKEVELPVLLGPHGDLCARPIGTLTKEPLICITNKMWNDSRELCMDAIKKSFESSLPATIRKLCEMKRRR